VNTLGNADTTAVKRARLAELDAALARLRAQYDLLMNAFKFEAARALVPEIEPLERERAALAGELPLLSPPQPTPYAVERRRRQRR
jgi:hypothetical protein